MELAKAREKLAIFAQKASNWPFGLLEAAENHETPNREDEEKEAIVATPASPKLPSAKAIADRRKGYLELWDSMTISDSWKAQAIAITKRIVANQSRYVAVVSGTGIPWWFVAIVHSLECSLRFDQHLHNGDPLTGRTTRIPPKRPASGSPPFTWEESARDALEYDDIDKVAEWSLPDALYLWHRYNGINNEYRKRGIPTPYLWSGTQHYKKGKYVKDRQFDATEVSQQVGAATLLKTLIDLKAVSVSKNSIQANVLVAAGSPSVLVPSVLGDGMEPAARELKFPGSLSEGSTADGSVGRLQEWLTLHNCATPVDGVFGPSTRTQLERFQQRNGRIATGVVDEDTWTLLIAPLLRALATIDHGATPSIQQAVRRVAAQHITQLPREAGGQARGPWVRLYADGRQDERQLLSSGFVCFIVAQAARDIGTPLPFARQDAVNGLISDAKETNRFLSGDAIDPKLRASKIFPGTIYVSESADGTAHCGIVKSTNGETFDTYEGSGIGGGPNGAVVMESNRSYSQKDFIDLV